MKTRKLGAFCIMLLVFCTLMLLVSCGGKEPPAEISVEYDVGQGKLPTDAPKTYEEGNMPDFSKVVPTLKNYTFGGWFVDKKLTTKFSSGVDVSDSLKLYAKWTPCQYNISFELSDGVCDNLPDKYTYGESLSLSDFKPTRDGYIFDGWFMDDGFVVSAETIDDGYSEDITVYAKWIAIPTLISEMPDVTKGCFPNSTSSVKIDLTEYVNKNGSSVKYNVSSSNTNAVKANVSGDELVLTFVNHEGYSDIKLDVLMGQTKYLTYEFRASAKAYLKVACVGDSLTCTSGFDYVDSLDKYLDSSVSIGNFGQSGIAVSQYSNTDGNGPYKTVCEKYSQCIAFEPDVIIIMLGTNDATKVENGVPKYVWDDIKEGYKTAYLDLIRSFRDACPDADIVVLTSPPVVDDNTLHISNSILETGTYPMQKEIAAEADAILVDTRYFVKNHGNYEALYRDGVHFTEEGSKIFAEYVVNSIKG